MSVVERGVSAKKGTKKRARKDAGKSERHERRSRWIAFLEGDDGAFAEWRDHLRHRKSPLPITKALRVKSARDSSSAPLTWGLEISPVRPETLDLIGRLWNQSGPMPIDTNGSIHSLISAAEAFWQADPLDVSMDQALLSVAWAAALPGLAKVLDAGLWRGVFQQCLTTANEAIAGSDRPETVAQHLFSVELPLTIAYQLPEMKSATALAAAARDQLCDSLIEQLDGAGLPAGHQLDHLRGWLATWTRCMHLARAGELNISRNARNQFDWLVRQALRLVRHDRTQLLWPLDVRTDTATLALFESALKLTGDDSDRALARLVLERAEVRDSKLPTDPGYESEWGCVAILQPEWSPREPRFAIDFSRPRLRCELDIHGQPLAAGWWDIHARINQQPLQAETAWDSICWHADEDVDYLEIECQLADGWKLHRQVLMARQDYFLFIADALIGSEPADLQLEQSIPLVEGVSIEPAEETVELFLCHENKRALVIPPALSEWQIDRRRGQLVAEPGRLRQSTQHRGRVAYLPLFIDLHPRRMKRALTWRQLTVGQALQAVPSDDAVGYRVHVGEEQWLFYRAFTRGVRSVLGQNLLTDFLCARFLTDGDIDVIVEIEDDDA